MQQSSLSYSQEMLKISTGDKYLNRYDNPVETNKADKLNQDTSKIAQYQDNLSSTENWEKATESALESVQSLADEAYALVVEMNNGISTGEDYTNLAAQFNEILESMVDAANTRYTGVELFAGVSTGADPYSVERDADGNITSVTFLKQADGSAGSTTRRSTVISDAGTTSYGTTGNQVFNYTHLENTAAEGETENWQNVNVDLFSTLLTIRDSLNNGSLPDAVYGERVQAAVDNVATNIVRNASSQNKISSISSNLTGLETSTTQRLSDVADLDAAEASTALAQYQTALSASYTMLSKMNEISFINYI